MPITTSIPVSPVSQEVFGKIAYEVVREAFAMHSEFGRFFDEIIYKRELARRMAGVDLEARATVTHGSFQRSCFADVLVNRSGLFEFKASESIHARHRAQTTHYLLLFGLHHGKIINMRPESVEHEFVNVMAKLADLRHPSVMDAECLFDTPGARVLKDITMNLVNDWGAGLDLSLYEEAITWFLGGELEVMKRVPITGTGGELAPQTLRLVTPESAFKLTAFPPDSPGLSNFRTHAKRLLSHTPLHCIQWINLHQSEITFATIQ
jgi:GxxExxY protein